MHRFTYEVYTAHIPFALCAFRPSVPSSSAQRPLPPTPPTQPQPKLSVIHVHLVKTKVVHETRNRLFQNLHGWDFVSVPLRAQWKWFSSNDRSALDLGFGGPVGYSIGIALMNIRSADRRVWRILSVNLLFVHFVPFTKNAMTFVGSKPAIL